MGEFIYMYALYDISLIHDTGTAYMQFYAKHVHGQIVLE